MKKNNKGFMLIEVIVTSTIVMTSMIALYTGFNKLYNNYRTKNTYYNLDAVYATKKIINQMITNDIINGFINDTISNQNYGYLIRNEEVSDGEVFDSYVSEFYSVVQKYYKIKNVIFSEYDKEVLKKIEEDEKELNQTFYDYINYVVDYYDIKESEEYNYIVLTEIEDGDNHYYANLRLR